MRGKRRAGREGERDPISSGYTISGIDQPGQFLSVFLFCQSGEIREQWSGLREATHIHRAFQCCCACASVCACGVQEHKWMNICAANSRWIWLRRVGACTVCGLLSMLMLLAQNLPTQRLRATAAFNLVFVIIIPMKHSLRSVCSFCKYTGSKWKDSGCFFFLLFFFFFLQYTFFIFLLL